MNTKEFVEFVEEQLKKQNVSYIAFLKEWFQVVNQTELFTAGEKDFEIMKVYKYNPDKTHILSNETNGGIAYVNQLIAAKQYQQAFGVIKQVIAMDPSSSLSYYMAAYLNAALKDQAAAEKNLMKAIELYPDYKDAVVSLSSLLKNQNRIPEAKNVLGKYIQNNPSDTAVSRILNGLNDMPQIKQDSVKVK